MLTELDGRSMGNALKFGVGKGAFATSLCGALSFVEMVILRPLKATKTPSIFQA
jgi:hypothetical protein